MGILHYTAALLDLHFTLRQVVVTVLDNSRRTKAKPAPVSLPRLQQLPTL